MQGVWGSLPGVVATLDPRLLSSNPPGWREGKFKAGTGDPAMRDGDLSPPATMAASDCSQRGGFWVNSLAMRLEAIVRGKGGGVKRRM